MLISRPYHVVLSMDHPSLELCRVLPGLVPQLPGRGRQEGEVPLLATLAVHHGTLLRAAAVLPLPEGEVEPGLPRHLQPAPTGLEVALERCIGE